MSKVSIVEVIYHDIYRGTDRCGHREMFYNDDEYFHRKYLFSETLIFISFTFIVLM